MFLTPSAFSIFAMMRMVWLPCRSSSWRISRMSSARLTKEAAMKSKPVSAPKRMSERSRSLM